MRNVLVEISVTEKPLPSATAFADYYVEIISKEGGAPGFVAASSSTAVQFRGIPTGSYTVRAFARGADGSMLGQPVNSEFEVAAAVDGGGGGTVQTYLAPSGLNVLVA